MGLGDKNASGTPDSREAWARITIAQFRMLPSESPSLRTGDGTGLVIPPVGSNPRAVLDSTPGDAACPPGHRHRTVTVTLEEARPAALFVTGDSITSTLRLGQ